LILSSNLLHSQASIKQKTYEWLKDPALRYAEVSYCVTNVLTGDTIVSFNPEKFSIPASIQKILTTAAALDKLGKDFRFKTLFFSTAKIANDGIVPGHLIIQGSGDPSLGSNKLAGNTPLDTILFRLSSSLKSNGIKRFTGSVIVDPSFFDGQSVPDSWQWDDLGNGYGAGAYGLNILENEVFIQIQPGPAPGNAVSIYGLIPPDSGVRYQDVYIRTGTEDNVTGFAAPGDSLYRLEGTLRPSFNPESVGLAMPDPPNYFAKRIKDYLQSDGIIFEDGVKTFKVALRSGLTPFSSGDTLLTYYSLPLEQLVKRANHESQNLYCESFLKLLGKTFGPSKSTKEGIRVVKDYWVSKGLNGSQWILKDGSGLSSRNAVTSAYVCDALNKIYANESFRNSFLYTLPIGGQSGTLKKRWKNSIAEGKVIAKSGSMERVRSFAGYVTREDGQVFSFSVMANNFLGSGGEMAKKLESLIQFLLEG
jgi:serine-type D-Ala-D-Ala carboxypeptidase/endopeptidase (penicillin-binding protein 4)